MIISLWSGPRNLSTAMMYFFAHRGDFQVIDEPFFGAFLKKYELWRPSRDIALATMETDPLLIHQNIEKQAKEGPIFLKNIANHLPLIDAEQAKKWKHLILFRHPGLVIQSYRKQMAEYSLFDLAYKQQYEWLLHLESQGIKPYLIDSSKLLENPEAEINALCRHLEIPFTKTMLNWPAGALKEDGVWAPYWYARVHQSTGFTARPESLQFPEKIQEEEVYKESLHYFKLLKKAHHEQIQHC